MTKQVRYFLGELCLRIGFRLSNPSWSDKTLSLWIEFTKSLLDDVLQAKKPKE